MAAFPERHEWVERTSTPGDLLWLLRADVMAASTSGFHPLPDIIDRAVGFAAWCYETGQHASVRESAAQFVAHLIPIPEARPHLIRILAPEALSGLISSIGDQVPLEDLRAFASEAMLHHGADLTFAPLDV